MEEFATVVQVLSNLAVIILCAFLIAFLIRLRGILEVVEKDIKELSSRTLPVLDNLEVVTDKIRNIAENVDDQVELVKDSINSVREIADNVVDFERRIQARIEEPVLETIGTIAAVLKGVRAFFVRLKA
ncbi:MAG TPA: DUF948 domain-containing protein [Bacteroidota bacterium]|nr:DUF948 domain-containing protein [Bacteroidota bacterium]